MALVHIFLAGLQSALQASSTVIIICLIGSYLTHRGKFPKDVRKGVSRLVADIFMPCLLLSKVTPAADWNSVKTWWLLPTFSVLYVLVGTLCGFVCARLSCISVDLRRFVLAGCSFANTTSIPVALVTTLLHVEPDLARGVLRGDSNTASAKEEVDRGVAMGITYILFYTLFMAILRWTVGYRYLSSPTPVEEVPLSLKMSSEYPDTPVVVAPNQFGRAVPPSSTNQHPDLEMRHLPPSQRHQHAEPFGGRRKPTDSSASIPPTTTEAPPTLTSPPAKMKMSLAQQIRKAFNPPVFAALLGLIIGLINPVKEVFFPVDDSVLGPTVTTALTTVGHMYVPAVLLGLGGNMYEDIKKLRQSKKEEEGKPANPKPRSTFVRVLVVVGVVKLLIVPIIGLFLVTQLAKAGLLPENDKIYPLVLMLEGAGPTAINMSIICGLHEYHEKEMGFLLLSQYLLSILTLTVWSAVFIAVLL